MKTWTGNAEVDGIVHDIITAYESAFPRGGLAYYLIGSWAEGESNALSDIDVAIMWTCAHFVDDDRVRSQQILASLASPIRLDAGMIAERDVPASLIGVNLKLSSMHLSGPDIRVRLPLPPLETYTESVTEGAYFFMTRILQGVEDLDRVDYPDPDDEFFGYTRKRLGAWYPTEVISGLKEWVATATRIARALVAIQAGRYVGGKGEAIATYRAHIGGEWGEYLSTLYQKGKIEWGYRVPEDEIDRNLLRDLCRRFLALEKHFLTVESG